MSDTLKNKVAIVTGSARGIGLAIARKLALNEATVILVDKNQSLLKKASTQLKNENLPVHALLLDLSKKSAPQMMIREVAKKFKRLDILINNARSGKRATLKKESESNWDETLSVTLKAAFLASKEATSFMKHSKNSSIVNISSVAASLVSKESPSYHVAKAGIEQLTRTLAVLASPLGIRVNAVSPGFIIQEEHQEKFYSNQNKTYRNTAQFCQPQGFVGCSEDIANAVAFLVSENARFINGQVLVVDGGLTIQEQSSLIFKYKNKAK